jgi:hypothetical protein
MATIPLPAPTDKLSCTAALDQAYALAVEKLPEHTHSRLAKGLALVQSGGVFETDDGYFEVASQREGAQPHRVTCTTCDCDWAAFNPGAICTHMASVMLIKKSLRLVAHAQTDRPLPATDAHGEKTLVDVTDLVEVTPEPAPAPHHAVPDILRENTVMIQGKPFVKVAGLLALAHQRGLQSLRTTFTYNDAELALAECTAVFPFGTYTDVGDADRANVNAKVKASFRRVAATRATARALRQALGVGMVAVEELESTD